MMNEINWQTKIPDLHEEGILLTYSKNARGDFDLEVFSVIEINSSEGRYFSVNQSGCEEDLREIYADFYALVKLPLEICTYIESPSTDLPHLCSCTGCAVAVLRHLNWHFCPECGRKINNKMSLAARKAAEGEVLKRAILHHPEYFNDKNLATKGLTVADFVADFVVEGSSYGALYMIVGRKEKDGETVETRVLYNIKTDELRI
jgi:predicted RNA-binding Zn-ribbon protein involved in translation (DUF1610 family)